MVLIILAMTGGLNKIIAPVLATSIVLGYVYAVHVVGLSASNQGGPVVKAVYTYNILRNGSYFAIGAI
ncbi:hypothetical protein R0K05_25135, partial [Planococcus sp. SIMBA_160]